MNKKKVFVRGKILCLSAILALLGAVSLYGREHYEQEQGRDGAYFLSDAQSVIDTYHAYGVAHDIVYGVAHDIAYDIDYDVVHGTVLAVG